MNKQKYGRFVHLYIHDNNALSTNDETGERANDSTDSWKIIRFANKHKKEERESENIIDKRSIIFFYRFDANGIP